MIQMTKAQLDEAAVDDLIRLALPILEHRRALYKRYRRKEHNNQLMGAICPVKTIAPSEHYIVSMAQGYLSGKAPAYSVRRGEKTEGYVKDYTARMDYIKRYNDDAATFMELMHDYLITTAAYLYVYENSSNEVVYTKFDSRQTIAIYDYSTPPNLLAILRSWKEGDAQAAELITAEQRQLYRNGRPDGEPETLQWKDVPAIAFEQPDGIAVFEPAITTIEAFEQIINNIRSMTRYNDEAKIKISGYTPAHDVGTEERKKEDEAIYKALCFYVGEGGDVDWILKNIDYSGLLSVIKMLQEMVTMYTGVPNMTDEAFSSADNASALGYKLYPLDQYSASTDRVFRKGYLRLWEIITNRLNLKGAGYDFRDIDIVMQRNIPTDRDKSLTRAVSAYQGGLLSRETAINESQIEVDATEEIKRIQAEEDAAYQKALSRVRAGENDDKQPLPQ